jgi:hypothetical protein
MPFIDNTSYLIVNEAAGTIDSMQTQGSSILFQISSAGRGRSQPVYELVIELLLTVAYVNIFPYLHRLLYRWRRRHEGHGRGLGEGAGRGHAASFRVHTNYTYT